MRLYRGVQVHQVLVILSQLTVVGQSGLEQVRECRHHVDLAAIFGEAAQASLLKSELLLEHPERLLNLGANVSFGRLDQILQLSIWCIR
jgi:hypothetical protein